MRESLVIRSLAVLCSVLVFGCQTRYHSAVPFPDKSTSSNKTIASVGIRSAESAVRDGVASALLARETGYSDLGAELAADDLARLLADPSVLAYAVDWRKELQSRLGARHVLVGDLTRSPVYESRKWIVELPIPLVYTILLVPIPIPYGRKPDVPHPSFVLRVVDLETGRIDSEFFAIYPDKVDRWTLDQDDVVSGLLAMQLRERPQRGERDRR